MPPLIQAATEKGVPLSIVTDSIKCYLFGMTNSEIWKPVEQVPGYSVSNFGRVRRDAGGQGARPMLRKQDLERTGYFRVRLSHKGQRYRLSVHRLVALAFLGRPPSPAHQIAHFDADKTNNAVSNLRWATCAENIHDKKRHGTQPRGMTQGRSKLWDIDIIEIRNAKEPAPIIAVLFDVCPATIRRIRRGEAWSHI
jgi:hypothetical protein